MGLTKYATDGILTPRKIAQSLRTTSEDLTRSAGLSKGAVQRRDRIASGETQRRLRELVAVINKVEPRLSSALMAYTWYRSQPTPGFSGQTACSSCEAEGRKTCSPLYRCRRCGRACLSVAGRQQLPNKAALTAFFSMRSPATDAPRPAPPPASGPNHLAGSRCRASCGTPDRRRRRSRKIALCPHR